MFTKCLPAFRKIVRAKGEPFETLLTDPDGQEMFCDHSQLRRRHKTAGQDVFLEYRRYPKHFIRRRPTPCISYVRNPFAAPIKGRIRKMLAFAFTHLRRCDAG